MLECAITRSGNSLNLSFKGPIDENAELPELDVTSVVRVDLNLSNVLGINSLGIRKWITWIHKLNKDVPLFFYECPTFVINQANIFSGFLPSQATVESLYVDFFCEYCLGETKVLLKKDVNYRMGAGGLEVTYPEVKCQMTSPNCSMEADVIDANYFGFLKR